MHLPQLKLLQTQFSLLVFDSAMNIQWNSTIWINVNVTNTNETLGWTTERPNEFNGPMTTHRNIYFDLIIYMILICNFDCLWHMPSACGRIKINYWRTWKSLIKWANLQRKRMKTYMPNGKILILCALLCRNIWYIHLFWQFEMKKRGGVF